MLSYIQKRNH